MLHASSEEVSVLLSREDDLSSPRQPRRHEQSGRTRRVLVAVAALALAAGAIAVAVDRPNTSANEVVTMDAHQTEVGDEPADMESQFGWTTITDGFCHVRAATWCMFKSDSATCKKEMCPDAAAPESSGNGSGSGSGSSHGFAHVGDSSGHHSGSGNEVHVPPTFNSTANSTASGNSTTIPKKKKKKTPATTQPATPTTLPVLV